MAQSVVARVAKAGEAWRAALTELQDALPEMLRDRQEGHENLQGILGRMVEQSNWLDGRLQGVASPTAVATDAGLQRRRDALAKAEADGNEEEAARLRAQLAALTGEKE